MRTGLFPGTIVAQADRLLSDLTPQLDLVEPVPFLHDTTTKNVVVSPEGHLSGIVDVDDLCYGDPRYPAALTAASLLNRGETTEYVSAWLARAGQAWDELFDFYVATFLLDFMSEHGTRFNGNEAASHLRRDRENWRARLYEGHSQPRVLRLVANRLQSAPQSIAVEGRTLSGRPGGPAPHYTEARATATGIFTRCSPSRSSESRS